MSIAARRRDFPRPLVAGRSGGIQNPAGEKECVGLGLGRLGFTGLRFTLRVQCKGEIQG